MTVICALHEAGVGTWIASDTLVSNGDLWVGYKRKWILGSGCALAVTGSNAALTLLEDRNSELNPLWTAGQVFAWAKAILVEAGFRPKAEEGGTPWFDCSYLFATPEKVLSIDSAGGGITFVSGQFASRGSGSDHADGAAYALLGRGVRYSEVINESIKAAIAHGNGCGGEVWIECLS